MTIVRRRSRAWLAAGGAVALLLGACSSTTHSSTPTTLGSASGTAPGPAGTLSPPPQVTGTISGPGVTATTITIGQITTTSGPVPGLFQGANDGLDAWVDYINSKGGIAGHTVKVLRTDDGFNCNVYTNTLQQYASQVFAMVGTYTLEDTCGKSVLAANPNLIDLQGAELDPTLYSVPNVFAPSPGPPGFQTTGYAYFKSRFPQDITHTASLVGAPAAANGKEEMLTAESLGYKYVYTRTFGPLETNFTSDILRMKNEGVKIVDLGAAAVSNDISFLQQAAQQNFRPDAVIGATVYDTKLLKLLGNASLANNIAYAALPYPLYLGADRASVPAVNTFLTSLDQAHPGATADIFGVSAWAAGALLLQAMSAAGARVDQASTLQALAGITTFDAQGLIAPSDPGQKIGSHCVVIIGVVNGQFARIHPTTGFDCSGVYHSVPLSRLK